MTKTNKDFNIFGTQQMCLKRCERFLYCLFAYNSVSRGHVSALAIEFSPNNTIRTLLLLSVLSLAFHKDFSGLGRVY